LKPAEGVGGVSADQAIAKRLGMAAQHHARTALSAYAQGERSADFYLNAGTALELAIKARLVRSHGLFCLAPSNSNWFQTYVLITKDLDATGKDRPKTVDAAVALDRLKRLEPELPAVFGPFVEETLERRNLVAHVGLGRAPSDEDHLSHAANFVQALNVLLRWQHADFWGDLAQLAEKLLSDEQNAVAVRVSARLAVAKALANQLTEEAFFAADESEKARLSDLIHEYVAVSCPACGGTALGVGYIIDDGDVEHEYEDGGWTTRWLPDFVTRLELVNCTICKLRLRGADEIAEAGLPDKVANERATSEDVYDG
jgi:hypothetical protein